MDGGMNNMKGTQMLATNKKCWDTVAPYFFQVDCLPKYGPYTASEDEIQSEIKKFLILGMRKWTFIAIYGGLIFQVHKLKWRMKR
jgi:hypothetical protein